MVSARYSGGQIPWFLDKPNVSGTICPADVWMDVKSRPLDGFRRSTPENEALVLYSSFPSSKPISFC